MKLFTKLFLQVFTGVFLMSQCMFIYFLYLSTEQTMEDTKAYESSAFLEKMWDFKEMLHEEKRMADNGRLEEILVKSLFQDQFGAEAVLFGGTQELYNQTPFQFSGKELIERKNKNRLEIPLVCRTGGRTLLVFVETEEKYLTGFQKDYTVIGYKDVTAIFERSRELFLKGLLFTLLMLLLLGGMLYRGIRRTLQPLLDLQRAAARISEGVYSIRVPENGQDEIAALGKSFNQMAEKVEEHVGRLSAINENQRQLLGSLAHELKTPMTAIIGYADTLLTVRLSDKRREQALTYIGNECARLSRLAVKMLELTGLYEHADKIQQKEESLFEMLCRLKDLTAYSLKEKKIELVIKCEPENLKRKMDADLMMSLFMNLVDNAFKASETGGRILVTASEEGITVEDFGKGIPKEEISHITQAFYMVDKARAKSQGSVGLGLALCQQIAQIHQGRLLIESEEGKGTRVSLKW